MLSDFGGQEQEQALESATRHGAIINISSIAAIATYPYVARKATKSAMIAFTEQLDQNAE